MQDSPRLGWSVLGASIDATSVRNTVYVAGIAGGSVAASENDVDRMIVLDAITGFPTPAAVVLELVADLRRDVGDSPRTAKRDRRGRKRGGVTWTSVVGVF